MRQPLTVLTVALAAALAVQGPVHAQGADTLKFSHKTHLQDLGLTCTDCHTKAATNTGKGMTNHPTMKTCQKCHEEQVAEKNCAMCHSSAKKAKPSAVALHHKNFSHADHLKRGVDCLYCHKNVDKIALATEKNLPTMESCFGCHNDKKAPRNCHLCHQDPERIEPASHKSPWFLRKEHGRDARFSRMECEKCHQETSCDACHMGQLSIRVHDPNFSFTHSIAARKGEMDCALCHEVDKSCVACHEARK